MWQHKSKDFISKIIEVAPYEKNMHKLMHKLVHNFELQTS